MDKIAVLITTFNRKNKLMNCLKSYSNQTIKPSLIIVVDNNSNDGTYEFLEEWKTLDDGIPTKNIVHLKKNEGGSGGFHCGMNTALQYEFDWLWIADDDAYPEADAFNELLKYTNNMDYQVICSSVITEKGYDISHRKIAGKTILGTSAPVDYYSKPYFPIVCFSFVGACMKREVILECGLPKKDFFIWYDDTEYSIRVNKKFKMLCVSSVKVFHDTIIEQEWRYSWKTYYGERNRLYTMKEHLSAFKFFMYVSRYKLGMLKHYFTDHRYYLSQRDGYHDFKKGVVGVPNNHLPGVYKY